jgi:DNA-binding NtrC family response regulator
VLKVTLPPLRSRPEDLALLVERLAQQFGADEAMIDELSAPEFVARLRHWTWPGNVRELRNYVQRCLVLREPPPIDQDEHAEGSALEIDCSLPYERARANAVGGFERRYITGLLRQAGGNVSRAARAAGIDRVYFHRLMRRHGVRAQSE